jgi:hypothetical protein
MLEKEREHIKLTESLLVSLELYEMDDTFFDMGAVSVEEVTFKQVTFSHKDGTTKSYRMDAVPTSFLEQYRNSRVNWKQVNARSYLSLVTHELMRRKREAKTILP